MRQCKVMVHEKEAGILQETDDRELQSRLLHIDENDDFGILLATAQFDTIGAVTVKPIE